MTIPRILVVGDAMLDRYWDGVVDRVAPEAPVPVLRVTRRFERPGGAANVARTSRRWASRQPSSRWSVTTPTDRAWAT